MVAVEVLPQCPAEAAICRQSQGVQEAEGWVNSAPWERWLGRVGKEERAREKTKDGGDHQLQFQELCTSGLEN